MNPDQKSDRTKLVAYVAPMVLFLACLGLTSLIKRPSPDWWIATPEFWIYPLQTVLCGGLLLWYRRYYKIGRVRGWIFTLAVGVVVFVLWISPQAFLGFAARTDGFNPTLLSSNPGAFWSTVMLRFLRLVVVVPLVEEIFWRGFLLRYLVREPFDRVPLGTFTWFSCLAVALAFMLTHQVADWPAAFITGLLYNAVAYRTKSLASCILAHAATNLFLGLWIMRTGQWGFW